MQKLAIGLMVVVSINLIACSKSNNEVQQPVIASQTVSIQKSDNSSAVAKDVVVGNSQQIQTTQNSTQQVVESKNQVVPADCTPKMGVDTQGDAAWITPKGCDQSQVTATPPSTQSTTPTIPAGAVPQAYVDPSSSKVVTATTIPTALPKGATNGHVEVKQTTVTKKTEQQILQPTK